MGHLLYVVAFFFSVGFCGSSFCPRNSEIQQQVGYRIWCCWIVYKQLNMTNLAAECQRSEGSIYKVEDFRVQRYLKSTIGPILLEKLGTDSTIWIDYTADLGSFENWEESIINQTGDCVTASQQKFMWKDTPCDNAHYGICYKELNCPTYGTYILTDDLCYWTPKSENTYPMLYKKAESFCNERNGTLAVIPKQNVLNEITRNTIRKRSQ